MPFKINYMEGENKLKPAYLFQGTQVLLIDRAIQAIENLLSKIDPQLETSVYHADTDPVESVIESASTVSMFGQKKLIILKNSESLKPADAEKLGSFIESGTPESTLVIVSNESNKPKIKKNKNLAVRTFSNIENIENQIKKEAGLLGLNLTPRACKEIHRLIGDDFFSISNELLKLAHTFSEKAKIDENDINEFISSSKSEDIFELINSIALKDKRNSLAILRNFENRNVEPISIISTVTWRFRQIWMIKELLNKKTSDEEIAKRLKVSKGAVFYIKKQAGQFTDNSLPKIIERLSRLETELKIYGQNRYNLLNRFVTDVCSY